MAEKKQEYLRAKERRRLRDTRGPALVELRKTVNQLRGQQKAFEDALDLTRSPRHNVKKADREMANLKQRLADAESCVVLAREELQRAIETRDLRQAEGQALSKKYEDQRSAIPAVPGCPKADEDVLHRADATVARALAVIIGADAILESRWEKP